MNILGHALGTAIGTWFGCWLIFKFLDWKSDREFAKIEETNRKRFQEFLESINNRK